MMIRRIARASSSHTNRGAVCQRGHAMTRDTDSDLPLAETSRQDNADIAKAMERARPHETAGVKLARAKVAAELFGKAATGLGRFRILERLGAGGMGVVHAAYDPDLDRGVALKVVPVPVGGRDAALAEAKALARLSHPNVVSVYDVGSADDHVYFAMELVRGETLGLWAQGRQARDIIGAYQQAGAALAAAHHAGLVHRDFKPDNAIMGADGRVRVVDFGLACEAQDPQQVDAQRVGIAGTPRYMPPEQIHGKPVTPAADQYSFCVALEDALTASTTQPPPRWALAVVQRGRALEPRDRFASMAELLKALSRDPARAARRGAVVGGAAMIASTIAFILGRQDFESGQIEPCSGANQELEKTWSATARTDALARLDRFGRYGSEVRASVAPRLETFAHEWVSRRRDMCLAYRDRQVPDDIYRLQTACLWKARAAFGAVAQIAESSSLTTLPELPRAVQELPDPSDCSNTQPHTTDPTSPPPGMESLASLLQGRLEEARIQLSAGRIEEARTTSAQVAIAARWIKYSPLVAEATLLEGHAVMRVNRLDAIPNLSNAMHLALEAKADAVAIEAWARRAYALGTSTQPEQAVAGFDVIETIAKRTESAVFQRALLYNNLGTVELARNQRSHAKHAFDKAIAMGRLVKGPGELELIQARANLMLATDDRISAANQAQDVIAELTQRLGAEHPDTLTVRFMRAAITIDSMPAAASQLERVCTDYDLHSQLSQETVICWTELGLLHMQLGETQQAAAHLEHALNKLTPAVSAPELMPYLTLLRGDATTAVQLFTSAINAHPFDETLLWDQLTLIGLELGFGQAMRALGEFEETRGSLEHAILALQPIVRDHPTATHERQLGHARLELVRTLIAMKSPRHTIAAVARVALPWLRNAKGNANDIAMLEHLID